jgi:hypothetical protein
MDRVLAVEDVMELEVLKVAVAVQHSTIGYPKAHKLQFLSKI